MTRMRRLYPQEMQKIAEAQRQPVSTSELTRSDQPSVTVVILSLDRLHLTRRCIDSVYANSDYPFQLLIWDNGSQPETIAYLKQLEAVHANVQVIYSGTNVGCGGGRNRAFRLVDTDYIFSMDNDMICHADWLRETMACVVRQAASFVAPMRLNPAGQVWSACNELIHRQETDTLEIARWFHDLPIAVVQSLFKDADLPTNFMSGGLGLFATRVFHEIGEFDENYRAGFEDLDISLRLSDQGYRVWSTVRALVTHDDEWQPHLQADLVYAQQRYDLDQLRCDADHFKARWGLEVLPEKYVTRFQQRLDLKLKAESDRYGL